MKNLCLKWNEVIEKHISEEEFSIEEFGEELGMSRMQVHRKLKALTGKSASQYIRTVKLERAKKMIEEKKGIYLRLHIHWDFQVLPILQNVLKKNLDIRRVKF